MPTPEEIARQNIDALLQHCGWVIQNYKEVNLAAARGIAIREVRLKEGRCDYLLLIDRANLGRQAMAEFQQFVTPDGRKFTELYNVQHLTSEQARRRLPRHHLHHPTALRHAPRVLLLFEKTLTTGPNHARRQAARRARSTTRVDRAL